MPLKKGERLAMNDSFTADSKISFPGCRKTEFIMKSIRAFSNSSLSLVIGLAFMAVGLTGAWAQASTDTALAPEVASGLTVRPVVKTSTFAVAAANPLATEAGYNIIKKGGSAVDAAVAIQAVLTLVEPQSSGIGGGAFLMVSEKGKVMAYDGREKAPSSATGELFMIDGEPLAFLDAAASGLSVGVPGTMRMLELAHQHHGKLSWSDLFQQAIILAEEGFDISPRLNFLLESDPRLRDDPLAGAFYYNSEGKPHPVGHKLQNPALATVLRSIAENGASAIHEGVIAEDVVRRVQNHPKYAGSLNLEDMAAYDAKVRAAICTPWKTFDVCGFPPPSSGHLTVMQILGIMSQLETPAKVLDNGVPSEAWLHQFLEASRLAFADRAMYIGDPDFVEGFGGNWSAMLHPEYLKLRAGLIGEKSMGSGGASAGQPLPMTANVYASQADQPEYGTSHISIVDQDGMAIAMTTTIEAAFGSRILSDGGSGLAGGFLLNNELTDFSFRPMDSEGHPIVNRVEPNKRPRSSMSPTLVFDQESGELVASLGSPGGAAIIHYTAKTMIAMLDWGLDPQSAVTLPHAVTLGGTVFLEKDGYPQSTLQGLIERGHDMSWRTLTSGLQAIRKTESGFVGGADPRREGLVLGD
jgi:gamma-glutamyltranspeptidase/glutathione hydrolase